MNITAKEACDVLTFWLELNYPGQPLQVVAKGWEPGEFVCKEVVFHCDLPVLREMVPVESVSRVFGPSICRNPVNYQVKQHPPTSMLMSIGIEEMLEYESPKLTYDQWLLFEMMMLMRGHKPTDYERDFGGKVKFTKFGEDYLRRLIDRLIEETKQKQLLR